MPRSRGAARVVKAGQGRWPPDELRTPGELRKQARYWDYATPGEVLNFQKGLPEERRLWDEIRQRELEGAQHGAAPLPTAAPDAQQAVQPPLPRISLSAVLCLALAVGLESSMPVYSPLETRRARRERQRKVEEQQRVLKERVLFEKHLEEQQREHEAAEEEALLEAVHAQFGGQTAAARAAEREEQEEELWIQSMHISHDIRLGDRDKAVERESRKRAQREEQRKQAKDQGVAQPVAKVEEHNAGVRALCTYGCGAWIWPGENGFCCKKGSHILGPAFNPPISAQYLELLERPSVSHNSRYINNTLAFGSAGTLPTKAQGGDGVHKEPGGLSYMKLQGKTYHTFSSPITSSFSGLTNYILPHQFVLQSVQGNFGLGYRDQLDGFLSYLKEVNPLAKKMKPIEEATGVDKQKMLSTVLKLSAGSAPTAPFEIARCDSAVPGFNSRVAYFDHTSGGTCSVPIGNFLYETLQYPLLFDEGKGGFSVKQRGVYTPKFESGVELTLHKYNNAMLFQSQRLPYLGQMAQEYFLDMYSREVEMRLTYAKRKDTPMQMRKQDLRGGNHARQAAQVGAGVRIVNMPSSFVGSKGYNKGLEEDAVEVCRVYGKPTFFITFTANPKWPEITQALHTYADGSKQDVIDRPDLVCRVFRLKLVALLEDLKEGNIFKRSDGSPWKTKFIMHVVEFQKRGLPHAHIAVRLLGTDAEQPKTSEDIDAHISARLYKARCAAGDTCNCLEHRTQALIAKDMMHTCKEGRCYPKGGLRCAQKVSLWLSLLLRTLTTRAILCMHAQKKIFMWYLTTTNCAKNTMETGPQEKAKGKM
jgi:hypothetical protein